VVTLVVCLWMAAPAAAQLHFRGCTSDDGTGATCVDGNELADPRAVAVSPDGKHVYAAAKGSQAVVVFSRGVNGTLAQVGCVSETGSGDACADGNALGQAQAVAVSPDGKSVYVSGEAVAVFNRASDGSLTQKAGTAGCVSDDGSAGGSPGVCADGVALATPQSIVVSPDGSSVYVSSGGVSVFNRSADGTLTQKTGAQACVGDTAGCTPAVGVAGDAAVAMSPDGTTVYAVNTSSDAVVALRRAADGVLTPAGCVSSETNACTDGVALDGAVSVAALDTHVYVAARNSNAVAILNRASDGTLTQKPGAAGCLVKTGGDPACTAVPVLDTPQAVLASPDGSSVYVAAQASNAVVGFARAADGTLAHPGAAGCVALGTPAVDCSPAKGFDGVTALAVSEANVYVAAAGSGAVATLVTSPIAPVPGELRQKPGAAGCIAGTTPVAGCASVGPWDDWAGGIAISPDDKHVYASRFGADGLSVFTRGPDGALTVKNCVSETGNSGACADGKALQGSYPPVVSPDGKNVYMPAATSKAIAVFDRGSDGTLTQKTGTAGCISDDGLGGQCSDATTLALPASVRFSPDGTSAYVLNDSPGDNVAVLDRAADGTLTQKAGLAGCVSDDGSGGLCTDVDLMDGVFDIAISPDGKSAYVVASTSKTVSLFDRAADGTLTRRPGAAGCYSRSGNGGACTPYTAADDHLGITISPDGKQVYLSGSSSLTTGGIVIFDRAADGTLTQKPGHAGCVSEDGTSGQCADGMALIGTGGLSVSDDGRSVYVASANAIAVFDRAPDGTLAQKPAPIGCISLGAFLCDFGRFVGFSNPLLSHDGKSLYNSNFLAGVIAVLDRTPYPPAPVDPGTPGGGGGGPAPGGGGTGPGGGGSPSGGSATPPDTAKPVISALKLGPKRFKPLSKGASIVSKGGIALTLTLSEAATVTFTVERASAGRQVRKTCVKQTRPNRRAKKCTRYTRVTGMFTHAGKRGVTTIRFSGRLGRRALKRGRYQLVAVARDAAGNVSARRVAPYEIR